MNRKRAVAGSTRSPSYELKHMFTPSNTFFHQIIIVFVRKRSQSKEKDDVMSYFHARRKTATKISEFRAFTIKL